MRTSLPRCVLHPQPNARQSLDLELAKSAGFSSSVLFAHPKRQRQTNLTSFPNELHLILHLAKDAA